jgi:hypothetical protein
MPYAYEVLIRVIPGIRFTLLGKYLVKMLPIYHTYRRIPIKYSIQSALNLWHKPRVLRGQTLAGCRFQNGKGQATPPIAGVSALSEDTYANAQHYAEGEELFLHNYFSLHYYNNFVILKVTKFLYVLHVYYTLFFKKSKRSFYIFQKKSKPR